MISAAHETSNKDVRNVKNIAELQAHISSDIPHLEWSCETISNRPSSNAGRRPAVVVSAPTNWGKMSFGRILAGYWRQRTWALVTCAPITVNTNSSARRGAFSLQLLFLEWFFWTVFVYILVDAFNRIICSWLGFFKFFASEVTVSLKLMIVFHGFVESWFQGAHLTQK